MAEGRTAIVTGGSRGIGREVSLRLAALGYDIAIVYVGDENEAAETVRDCEANGIKAKASGHYRIAGEMAGKKPQIRGYIKFSLNKTKTMFSAIIIYMGNSIKHQHIGGGKLAVAGTEQFAAAAG